MAASDIESDFLTAASAGDLTLLKRLALEIGNGNDGGNDGELNDYEMVMDGEGRNALHLAAAAGKTQICKYLVEKLKFHIILRDQKGNSPLHIATLEQRHQTAAYLIENGGGINFRNIAGFTPLHYAAEKGQKELMRLLLSKGAKVKPDLESAAGTPLHCASLHGKKEAVKILLENGADPNYTTKLYLTPLMLSLFAESYECMELLLKAGADPNLEACGKSPLIVAACGGDPRFIKHLLKVGANPNFVDTCGVIALEHAAMRGNVAAVNSLFPCTSRISSFPDWSVSGIMKHVMSEEGKAQREIRRKNDFEASKAKGRAAFEKKEYEEAIFWYTQANLADPTDETVLSNRSLCWTILKQGNHALEDAEACIALKPNWAKAHYREGAAWMVLHNYPMATEAFSEALKLDPNNKEIKKAQREAVAAEFGRPVSENLQVLEL